MTSVGNPKLVHSGRTGGLPGIQDIQRDFLGCSERWAGRAALPAGRTAFPKNPGLCAREKTLPFNRISLKSVRIVESTPQIATFERAYTLIPRIFGTKSTELRLPDVSSGFSILVSSIRSAQTAMSRLDRDEDEPVREPSHAERLAHHQPRSGGRKSDHLDVGSLAGLQQQKPPGQRARHRGAGLRHVRGG